MNKALHMYPHKKQSLNSNCINMSETSSIFVHAIPETGRLLPSASRWNSIELEFRSIFPSSKSHDDTMSKYSKSYNFRLTIADKSRFKRFVYITIASVLLIIVAVLLFVFLHHKHHDRGPSSNLPLVLEHALSFFDAQKSGVLPKNNPAKFRGDSGLNDVDIKRNNASLVGGFYDSGNNIKFSFTTAYTVTLLSWSVVEYHEKYSAMGQLDHVMDIIKWGSDYLLKLFVPGDSEDEEGLIYSQVGSADTKAEPHNDITCWQRPEDMTYIRPISTCTTSASDLAGEITAALSAASLIFIENKAYSNRLVQTAQKLFNSAKNNQNQGTYSSNKECGDASRDFYNSTSFLDELAWGSTWLFLATGDFSHLQYATETFQLALNDTVSDNRVFDWNNKIAANAILLTRLRYLHDPGYPYEDTLKHCSEMIDAIMCSYLSPPKWMGWVKTVTPGGLILPSPFNISSSLQFASTASFLSKLYSDYLNILQVPAWSCSTNSFSPQALKNFADSQILHPRQKSYEMSYVVGFGDHYPKQVHHRAASIPWDGKHYNCSEGKKWRLSKDPNPNTLLGAMVAGPSYDDKFTDQRDQPKFTEPTIAGNAGLVAALAALVDPSFLGMSKFNGGIDQDRIFAKIT